MPQVSEARLRTLRAAKKRKRADELWDPDQNKWQRYARCKICRRRFVANNYADRKPRLRHLKIAGKVMCPWCRHRDGKFVIQLLLIAEKVANHEMSFCHSPPEERPRDDCKCLACVAGRILRDHDELPTLR